MNEKTPLVASNNSLDEGNIVVDLPNEEGYNLEPVETINTAAASSGSDVIKRRSQIMLGGGGCIVFMAFICAAVALIIHVSLGAIIDQTIHDSIQLVPENEEWYKMFITNEGSEVAQYNSIIMFNMTNPDEVRKGAKPNYVQLDPVLYRRYYRRFNITFSPDRDTVSFRYYTWYQFEKNSSTGPDPYTSYVYNINPVYLGVMLNTGGESKLMRSMTGGAIEEIMHQLTSEFVEELERGLRSFVLRDKYSKLTDGRTLDEFLNIWSNALTPPSDDWKGMLLSDGQTIPTNISLTVAQNLFSLEDENALMALDPEKSKVWFDAYDGDKTARVSLMQLFNLNDFEMDRILQWFKPFLDICVFQNVQEQFIDPNTKKSYIQTKADMGWVQWGVGGVSPYGSVTEGPFGRPLPGYPEIYYFAKYVLGGDEVQFNIFESKEILNSTSIYGKPIFQRDNAVEFLRLYDEEKFDEIQQNWNMDQKHAKVMGQYMYYLIGTFINDTLITKVFNENIGLITKKTIHEWVMSYDDPLIKLLKQAPRRTTLVHNDTSEAEVYKTSKPSVQNTGHYNQSFVAQFMESNGSAVLDMWAAPVPINGTDGRQFLPHMTRDSKVTIWNPDRMRPQEFSVVDNAEHYGISCYRLRLSPWNMYPNPVYYNKFFGMGNLTVKGSPMFISKWYWLDTQPLEYWSSLVNGVQPSNPKYDTYLDVEPTTGITLSERKRFMLSAWLENSTNWLDTYHKAVRTGIMYPVVMIDEYADVTPDLADKLKMVYVAQGLQVGGFWAFVVLFIALTGLGFGLVFKGWMSSPVH